MPLTDAQWAKIEPLLPDRTPRRGGRWRDHRLLIDAIAFKYRTGTPWTDLPEKYGSWKGVHNRLRNWAIDGTWKRVFTGCSPSPTPKATWSGLLRSTPRSCAPTSTPPVPARRPPRHTNRQITPLGVPAAAFPRRFT
ncbi:transposase [Streptomyces sp. SID7803]|nr:transposase [Streptomyces sp. SID7803]